MPYDPALPINGSLILATELRSNSNELKALIDAQAATIAALQAQANTLQTQANNLQTQLNTALGRITTLENAGYVTQTEIDSAIAGTANNVNGISDLGGMSVSDPPQQGEMQTVADKVSEVINALHR